uniref:Uncharacterized protein n=1 Tax=Siphoviridae sp. ctGN02 TaxID=2825411 RepID=A0A8S5PIK9_9CAUD|nr:MAG TPA: hypothetical protein [Siphoviridae sp. ctGN02]
MITRIVKAIKDQVINLAVLFCIFSTLCYNEITQ